MQQQASIWRFLPRGRTASPAPQRADRSRDQARRASGALATSLQLLELGHFSNNIASNNGRVVPFGFFWVGQQTQFNNFIRSDRHLTWLHIAFLLAVTLMPFSTGLLAAYITFRVALVVYWLNIVLLGLMLFVSWRYARHAQIMKDEVTAEIFAANQRRILIAQSLYAFGALLCIINTYVSIGFIVLVQQKLCLFPNEAVSGDELTGCRLLLVCF